MVNIPSAPWHLTGEAICFMASPFAFRLLVNYQSSPVGPYHEHALVKLIRYKGVLAPHVSQMSVDLEASEIGGRAIWGFPKTPEKLAWSRKVNRVEFKREDEKFNVRVFGPKIPICLSFFSLQQHEKKWVKVPGHIKGKCRMGFRGKQFAVIVSDFFLVIDLPEHA